MVGQCQSQDGLYCTSLRCTILLCTALQVTALHSTAHHCTTEYCTALPIILHWAKQVMKCCLEKGDSIGFLHLLLFSHWPACLFSPDIRSLMLLHNFPYISPAPLFVLLLKNPTTEAASFCLFISVYWKGRCKGSGGGCRILFSSCSMAQGALCKI